MCHPSATAIVHHCFVSVVKTKEMGAFKGNGFRLSFLSNKPVSPSCKAKLSLSSLVPFRPLGPEGSSKECSEAGTSKLLSCSGQDGELALKLNLERTKPQSMLTWALAQAASGTPSWDFIWN